VAGTTTLAVSLVAWAMLARGWRLKV
jgi:hypothetical protein